MRALRPVSKHDQCSTANRISTIMPFSSCLTTSTFSTTEFSYFRREFQLHYQPIVSLETGKIKAFEALVRWQKNGMMLYPAEFMPKIQSTGMIIPLGIWILHQTCQQVLRWQEQFSTNDLVASVNLSIEQLQHPKLVQSLSAILAETGLSGKYLQIEIPAKVLRLDTVDILRTLEQIKDLGVRLLIDNFNPSGTPLTSIHDYGIDAIKINQSAVSGLSGLPIEQEAFETVVGWLQSLDIDIVLNRVETLEQVASHQAYGCKYAQGYLFSQPISARAMTTMLTEKSQRIQTLLDANLMAVNKLKKTLKRFLSQQLVSRYWLESKPVDAAIVKFNPSPISKGLQNFGAVPIDMRFQTMLQQWVDNFVDRCGYILRDLPWMLNHSDLTIHELQLLKIQRS